LIHFYKRVFRLVNMKTLCMVRVTQRLLQPPIASSAAVLSARNLSFGGQQEQNDRRQHKRSKQGGVRGLATLAATAAATAAAAYGFSDNIRCELLAEEDVIAYENRIRQHLPPDQIFNYFSTFMVQKQTGTRSTVMMTPMDLFNAVTPESPGHSDVGDGAAGAGNYITVTADELGAGLDMKRSPLENSMLNKIGDNGLLTYDDFCFLLTILSTPTRYVETAFKLFDITGDGNLEAKEFEILASKLSFTAGGFGRQIEVDQNTESGLMNYLFGKDRTKTVSKEAFFEFYNHLQDELIELEFREYDKENTGRISEEDLGKFFMKHSNIPPKAKNRMLKRVKKEWPSKKRGVSLPSFKNLYKTLAGGEDLERAVYFMDEGKGLDYDQVRRVSHWVTTEELLSDHVARVIFVLLDDDQNGYLTKDELHHVLYTWRKARGFEKLAVNVTMGPKYPKKAGI